LITSTQAVVTEYSATKGTLVVSMGRKAASISTRVDRKLVRGLGHASPSAKTAHLRQVDQAARGDSDRSHDRDVSAGPTCPITTNFTDPEITDNLPKFAAVLDRELDAIETYLGALLEEMLGRLL
jgi:hypothetical protein